MPKFKVGDRATIKRGIRVNPVFLGKSGYIVEFGMLGAHIQLDEAVSPNRQTPRALWWIEEDLLELEDENDL